MDMGRIRMDTFAWELVHLGLPVLSHLLIRTPGTAFTPDRSSLEP